MARSMRYALLLMPLMLITTACRFVEQQKDLAARVAAFTVLRPILQMQSNHAPLTQSSSRPTEAVAAKQTPKPGAPAVTAGSEIDVQELRFEAELPLPVVAPMMALNHHTMRIDATRLRTMAMSEARHALAVSRCELQMERAKKGTQRKRIIVIAPGVDLDFDLPSPAIGG
jgi:hypothetical protein